MIVKWIKYKDGYVYTTDITEAVSSVSWGGSTSQAARTAEIAVINAPNDKNVTDLKLKIAAGDTIKLYENNTTLFIGEVITKETTSETGTVTYSCTDLLNHLLKSTGVKGTIVKNFVLADEYNITNTKYEETIDSMVNVVKIYDENKKQVGEVKNGNWIDKYGIYQQIYTKEKGINAETAAKNMLSGVEKKVTLDGINGDLSCIAGNGVEVYDKATGLNGVFWIDSDTHTWENGTHIMSLELNFKNIMDSKEYDETEE